MPADSSTNTDNLKLRVARTLKWNIIDRVASQFLYAITGIVLANELSQEDFGLVGAILVFQAFASLFIDSGFSSALIQRQNPTLLDYSTIFWFNLATACVIYVILSATAPFIAGIFQGDERLIPLSRVMFLSFIINAMAIIQTNRLMKQMDVRMIAISNSIALATGAVVGIYLAVSGYGAWTIVWQTITVATVKSTILWATSSWMPMMKFSFTVLRGFFGVGSGVMFTSLLTTVFQNLYSFFIGHRAGLVPLGYFSQADKWSKMGIMSLSQVLTSSFLPLLSKVQDDMSRFSRMCGKTHRFTCYLLFPAMGLLAIMATPLFHLLFSDKWDASIPLFQILLLRGIFTVLSLLYSNFILSLGRSRLLVVSEIIRDVTAIIAIVFTLGYITPSTSPDILEGLQIFLLGQLAASFISWCVTLAIVISLTHRSLTAYAGDAFPYAVLACLSLIPGYMLLGSGLSPLTICCAQTFSCLFIYIGVNALLHSRIQTDMIAYFRGKPLD